MNRGLLPAALLLLARIGAAQEIGVAGQATHTFRPAAHVDGAPGVDVGVQSVQAALSVRIPLGPRTFLTPGFSYQGQFLSYTGTPTPDSADDLHTLEVPVMLLHIFDQSWSFFGRVAPGLSGDFDGLDRHFRFSAMALAGYSFGPRLSLGLGAVLLYGAGKWQPLPAARIAWHVVDGFHVEALLPAYVKALYRFDDRWEVGAAVQGEGARWAVHGDGETKAIDYFAIDVGGQLGVRVAGNVWINAFAGWNAWRRYEVDGGAYAGKYDPETGVVVRGGVEIRLPGN